MRRDNTVNWSVALLSVELLASFDREMKPINTKRENRETNIWMDGGPTTSCTVLNNPTNEQMPKNTTPVPQFPSFVVNIPFLVIVGDIHLSQMQTKFPNKEIPASALQAPVLPGFVVGWLGEPLSALLPLLSLLVYAKQALNENTSEGMSLALVCP